MTRVTGERLSRNDSSLSSMTRTFSAIGLANTSSHVFKVEVGTPRSYRTIGLALSPCLGHKAITAALPSYLMVTDERA